MRASPPLEQGSRRLTTAASPLIFIVVAMLDLAANFASREFHSMDIGVGRVGAESIKKRPEVPRGDVLSGDRHNARRGYCSAHRSARRWAGRRPRWPIAQVRTQESIDAARNMNLAKMEMRLRDV